jgi:molecular chaperone GrpE
MQHRTRPSDDLDQDDDVEIIEVVGFDEPVPQAPPEDSGDDDEVLLDLDEEPEVVPVAAAAPAREPSAEDDEQAAEHPGMPGAPTNFPRQLTDRERLFRMRADFENFKKRTERDRRRHESEATAELILRMLPVLDNFERAIEAGNGSDAALRDGVVLIFRQILDELRKEGLHAIEAVGEVFDPEVHEAVETDSASGFPAHTVIGELQRGYKLGGRLLRPALVKVAVDPLEQTTLTKVVGES